MLHNYVASSGPQCNNPPGGACASPFQLYCNGTGGDTAADVPPQAISPGSSTYPGYGPSMTWGNTNSLALVRGMFSRGTTIATNSGYWIMGGAKIRTADVTDGTSNTLLLGEMLPEFSEFQRFPQNIDPAGWAGGDSVSQGQTIQIVNWPIDPVPDSVTSYPGCGGCNAANNPSGTNHCLFNWSVTWGFRSKHPGGVNFALADGSVRFISETIDHQTYQYLGCRNDSKLINPP